MRHKWLLRRSCAAWVAVEVFVVRAELASAVFVVVFVLFLALGQPLRAAVLVSVVVAVVFVVVRLFPDLG